MSQNILAITTINGIGLETHAIILAWFLFKHILRISLKIYIVVYPYGYTWEI